MLKDRYESLLAWNFTVYHVIYTITFSFVLLSYMLLGICFYNYQRGHWSRKEFLVSLVVLYVLFLSTLSTTEIVMPPVVVSYTLALAVFSLAYIIKDRMRRTTLLDLLGQVSYPLYILHGVNGFILMSILDELNVNPYLNMTLTTLVVLCLSYLFHRLVEDPSNQLGKKLAARVAKSSSGFAGAV
jgi:peptidoglycan/LPS O-acetylase OafA/YrhL